MCAVKPSCDYCTIQLRQTAHAILRLDSMSDGQIGRRSKQVERANLCSVGVISSAKQLLKAENGEQILASAEDRFIYNS